MTTAELRPILRDFKRKLRERKGATDTPNRAFNVCHETSLAFLWFCVGSGIKNAKLIWLDGIIKPITVPGLTAKALKGHYVVRVGSLYIDWTARQFWPDDPYPLVMNRSEVLRRWEEILT